MPFSNLVFSSINGSFFILMSICLYFELSTFRKQIYLRKHGVFAEGRTISGSTVRFVTDKGYRYDVDCGYGTPSFIGSSVHLLYDPHKPWRACVAFSSKNVLNTTFFLTFSLLLTLYSACGIVFSLNPALFLALFLPFMLLSFLVARVYVNSVAFAIFMKYEKRNTSDTQAPYGEKSHIADTNDALADNKE